MKVTCISNQIDSLDIKLRKFAFTQLDNALDLTVGKTYEVYGLRENKLGTFYLILTDTIRTTTPWWMPAALFRIEEKTVPLSWSKDQWRGYGKETVYAHPAYFNAMDDIEDNTEKGQEVFRVMSTNNK